MTESGITQFRTSEGGRIYRLPLDLFPALKGYAHLIFLGDVVALVDVGSGFGDSNDQLEAGLAAVTEDFGETAGWENLTHVIISHGHIDHFGGLQFVRERAQAPIGVHELDRRVLTKFEERLTVVAHRLREFLIEAGVSDEDLERLMNMYLFNKHLFKSVDVDFTFEEVGMRIGPLLLIHVPGHCPGQIVIQADDILFSSDHILGKTTPHQAPEQITLNTGLGHYLESLDKVMPLSSKVNLTLGGHEDPIPDLRIRIDEIKRHHEVRLAEILDHLNNPMTISELSYELFHETEGYNEILALQETGSHVEYLAQRGYLAVDNLDDMQPDVSVPIHYRYSDGVKPPRIT